MQALVPSSLLAAWTITGSGRTDGEIDDVTVAVMSEPGSVIWNLRTMTRTGTRIGPRNSVHGQVTDVLATAALAIESLLLGAIPAGLEQAEAERAMSAADAQARGLAADREAWALASLTLDGISYALWRREVPGGVAAHADLGWATVAMWSTDVLPDGSFDVTEVAA